MRWQPSGPAILAKIMTGSAAELDEHRVRREVVSFVRRSNRMRASQRHAWEVYRDRFVLEVPRLQTSTSISPTAAVDLVEAFGRDAELIVEIGPGTGESLIPMAAARPNANVLAFEVYRPAIARMLGQLVREGLDNVRIVEADAVAGLEQLLPPGSVDAIWMFFPDPWPKPRHHKRRLLTPAFAALAGSRMKPDAIWRIATDSADYASWMREVLDNESRFASEHPNGWALRWQGRPITQFEQRGLDAGRQIFDLAYRRVG
ncbi:MAG TPA: tRNA (guanosine(46)-N7)-methyltransferase TrmB [Propionibacteriaceae bacterium]|nr:tRNA (guanosine(46)-N7)-methyltransferase TrmB [Propionibacteriaceae bacterium]